MEVVLIKVVVIGFTTLVAFILGTVLGSFVKALADRSLKGKSFRGRSYCSHCKHILRWYDLLPIISYLSLRGKCRYCGDRIEVEYLVVEVGMGLLVGLLFSMSSSDLIGGSINNWIPAFAGMTFFLLDLIFKTFFITILSILFLTDIKKMLIPDRISLPAIWISLAYLAGITIYKVGYLYYYLQQSAIGKLLLPPHSDYFLRHALITAEPLFYGVGMGLLIGGFFWLLIMITKGKGMGGGDVKLGALMGLALGFPNSLVALMLAFLTGAIVSLVLILGGKKHFGQSIPFGPFLVLGSMVTLFWGSQIIDWYLKLGS